MDEIDEIDEIDETEELEENSRFFLCPKIMDELYELYKIPT